MTGLPWDRTPVASSLLATRNPLVKLIVLFVVSIVVMFWFDPLRPGVLWALLLVGTVVGAKLSPKALLVSQLVFAGFALGTLLVNIVTRPDDPDALAIGFSLAFRTMAIGTASVAFIASTDAVALVTSLHENGRLPARFAYSLLAGYASWKTCRASGPCWRPPTASATRSSGVRVRRPWDAVPSRCSLSRSARASGWRSRSSCGAWSGNRGPSGVRSSSRPPTRRSPPPWSPWSPGSGSCAEQPLRPPRPPGIDLAPTPPTREPP